MAIPAFVFQALLAVVGIIAPNVRKLFEIAMQGVYKSAMESPNKIDDIGVKILITACSIDVSGVVVTPSPDSANLPPDVVDAVANGFVTVISGSPFAPPGNELGGA